MNSKRVMLILILLFLVCVSVIWGTHGVINYANSSKLATEIQPFDATVKIDDRAIRANKTIRVRTGSHTITIQRVGFKNQSQNFTLSKGKSEIITVYLKPANSIGYKWLKDHPSEALKYEGHAGSLYNADTKKAISLQPFIKELPFIAGGFEFRVDYGSPAPGSDKPIIYIQADTQEARDDALLWIKNKGYDPTTMLIVYTTSINSGGD